MHIKNTLNRDMKNAVLKNSKDVPILLIVFILIMNFKIK
ncbi:hypothetical protein EMUCRT_0241 [Ehrlichia cf. muris str. EmCRT]|uniref:Uncharacterized protein n=1 Tax=Ehrlichia cf. muris str. EmCRT TaxID=1359167 RepID=A0A0F3NDG8_9RICK|nr:hypothetical protein EMUCRT_0241 [Ehrlichia cf. muris str. EmCRT]